MFCLSDRIILIYNALNLVAYYLSGNSALQQMQVSASLQILLRIVSELESGVVFFENTFQNVC